MTASGVRRPVAVFDLDRPPGIAFLRALGRAGIPATAFTSRRGAAGRWSRHVVSSGRCPRTTEVDEFTGWLEAQMRNGRIDLVAPTSDCVAFAAAEARSRVGLEDCRHPTLDAVLDCLLKPRFDSAMAAAGFPTPRTEYPTTIEAALEAAARIGYPVVLKPRTHVGLANDRGAVVRTPEELVWAFGPHTITQHASSIRRHETALAIPLLQRYEAPEDAHLISMTGCLDQNGDVLAVGQSRKLRQWPARVGVGTLFEAVEEQPFTQQAIEAVRTVLGRGIFELEVLVDRTDPERFWAIDLNPRAFGQITLDITNGRDLPVIWFRSVTGRCDVQSAHPVRSRRYWQQSVPFYAGVAVDLVFGPDRMGHMRDLRDLRPRRNVGATRSWSDPLPSILLAYEFLRHPRALLSPYLDDRGRAAER